jgi:hypothetical protein
MPVLKGLVNEVRPPNPEVSVETNLGEFLLDILFKKEFREGTFGPLANAKVHLGIRAAGFPSILPGFFPALSLEADTRGDGRFEIDIPDQIGNLSSLLGYVVIFKEVLRLPRPNAPSIRIFEPLYRSELFPLTALDDTRVQFFGTTIKTEDTDGVPSTEINAKIDTIIESLAKVDEDIRKLKDISATITATGLHFVVQAAANTRGSFDLQLSPNTGPASKTLDEDLLLRAKITNVVTERGNVFGRLCKSRAKLEEAISIQASTFGRAFSSAIIERLKKEISIFPLMETCFSVAIANVRFPLVETTVSLPGFGSIPLTHRLLALDVSIGYPRNPFNPNCVAPPPVD